MQKRELLMSKGKKNTTLIADGGVMTKKADTFSTCMTIVSVAVTAALLMLSVLSLLKMGGIF